MPGKNERLCLEFGTCKINKYRSLRIEYFVGVFRLKPDSNFWVKYIVPY